MLLRKSRHLISTFSSTQCASLDLSSKLNVVKHSLCPNSSPVMFCVYRTVSRFSVM